MTFTEWADEHGIEKARKQFKLSDHMVFTIFQNSVSGVCGNWRGSEPVDGRRNKTNEDAKERLRAAILHSNESEEEISA